MDQMQQGTTSNTTTATPTPAIIAQRTKQAYSQASGPLATKDLLNRPWFRENGLGGPTVGRAISALVRAHEIHKVREGVYQAGAGPQHATGTPASSSTQARSGNGATNLGPGFGTRKQPKKASSSSKSQTKRIGAQTRTPNLGTTSQTRSNQRQQSGKQQYARTTLGAAARKGAQPSNWSNQPTQAQGALVQRIQTLEASNRHLTQQVDRMMRDMYGQQPG